MADEDGDLLRGLYKLTPTELVEEAQRMTSRLSGLMQTTATAQEVQCPSTGGDHVWTDDVGPEHEHYRPEWRWHCDECGAGAPKERDV